MQRRKLKKQEIRKDPFREFLAKTFTEIETSFETNWKSYLFGFIALIVAVALIYFYIQGVQLKKEKTSYLITQILETAQAPVLDKNDPIRDNYKKSQMKYFTSSDDKTTELKKQIKEFEDLSPSKDQKCAVMLAKASSDAKSGNYSEALKTLEEISRNSKYRPSALQMMANIYEIQKDNEKAENIYKELAKLNSPDLPKPIGLKLLADFYERQNKMDDAIKTYKDILTFMEQNKNKESKEPPETLLLQAQSRQIDFASQIRQKITELQSK